MDSMPTREQILEALRVVIDPELRRDIVELEMVRSIEVKDGGVVDVTVSLTTPGCPIRSHFQTSVVSAAKGVEGVAHVNVAFDVHWGELDYLLIDLPPGTGDVSMTLSQLLPEAKFVIVTTPQAAAQKVARRSAQMAHKVKLDIGGVIENMSGFTTPGGERFQIFGEGGGQLLADELEVPLLGKVPLTMPLRATSDQGVPLIEADPDDPAAQAIRAAARGIVAITPVDLPVLADPVPPAPVGMSLPMA